MKKITKQKINFILLSLTLLLTFGLTAWSGLADDAVGSFNTASNLIEGTSVGLSEIMAPSPLAITTGTIGTDVAWTLDTNESKLTIYPTNGISGILPDSPTFPWENNFTFQYVSSVEIQGTIYAGEKIDGMFANFSNITTIEGIENLDVSSTRSVANMFSGCGELRTLEVGNWNTSNIEDMSSIFSDCRNLTMLDVSHWNTSSVKNMSSMFSRILYWSATPLQLDVSHWDVSQVTNMNNMFYQAYNYSGQLDVSQWVVSNVESMELMFSGCRNITALDVSQWDTSKVTNINGMFSNCEKITTLEVGGWKTEKITNMSSAFSGCSSITTLDVSGWDTQEVSDMSQMFSGCTNIDGLDVSSWKTSNLRDLNSTFSGCTSLSKLDVSGWDTTAVYNMTSTFARCENLLFLDVSGWDTQNVYNMTTMFTHCSLLPTLDVSGWDMSKVTDISQMFNGCENLTTLDVSQWDTSSITQMYSALKDCKNLEKIDVSHWDTSQTTRMEFMFQNTAALKEIDVSSFDTGAANDMRYMFDGTGVREIDASNFVDTNIYFGYYGYEMGTLNMFSNAPNLRKVNVSSLRRSDPQYSINMFTNSPVTELVLGDSWKIEATDLSVEQFSNEALAGYSNEWKYLGTPTVLYADGDDFISGYNQFQSAGTYIRMGITYSIQLDAASGELSDGLPTHTISTRYKVNSDDGVTPIEIKDTPYKKGYDFLHWNTAVNGEGVTYQNGDFVENLTTVAGETVVLYAQWKAIPYTVTFDMNGVPKASETQISTYESLLTEPVGIIYTGYIFDGWYKESDTTNLWDFDSDRMPAEDMTLYAKWISIADLIHVANENVVMYKNESTAEEVESAVGITVDSYMDYKGIVHSFTGVLDWNPSWIGEGGVNEMKVYVVDSNTKEEIFSSDVAYLYVLNRPYIDGPIEMWIFEGETLNPDIYSAIGYGEVPDFENKRINRERIDLTFDASAVNIWDVGTYWASYSGKFEDYMLKASTFSFPVTVHVQKRAGLTKEEKQQVNSSDFWVKVTEIYHTMEKGQIIDVTPSNYTDGGSLRKETVPSDASYDRQLNVEVGEYIYMSPDIVNVLQEEKTGQMKVLLNGRSWIFDSSTTEAVGNNYPKGYYDLRMDLSENESIIALVGADTPQMQLGFSMNRTWFGTPTFVIAPNESIKSAVAGGATPYLFHYNDSTNELELVGSMAVQSNGSLSIPMNGVYKDYVILTNLPSNGNYRITEHTNALDSETYEAVANNIIDSDHVLPSGNGLNGISTTKYAQVTTDTMIAEKSSSKNPILIAVLSIAGIALISGGYLLWKKRKELDD